MPYETYATLLNKKLIVPSRKTAYIAVDRSFFVETFSKIVASIFVDEGWYLNRSPDVGEAIKQGSFSSAGDHYASVGFYEHRMPYEIDVEESWYLENYADIAEAVHSGVFQSGREHFYSLGYREGRFPHPSFTLRTKG